MSGWHGEREGTGRGKGHNGLDGFGIVSFGDTHLQLSGVGHINVQPHSSTFLNFHSSFKKKHFLTNFNFNFILSFIHLSPSPHSLLNKMLKKKHPANLL